MVTRKKLTTKNILGYGVAAFAFNSVYVLVSNYVNFFFTNVLGIGLAAVGTIMLVARLWDGVNDPIMGTIVDKTRNPKGKYRIYMLWGILPLALTTFLLFLNPNVSMGLKIAYGSVIYILWDMAYTFANIPYMAMQSTLSPDSNERTKIITLKNIFVMIGAILPTILVPAIAIGKEGAKAQGFMIVGLIGAVLLIVCMLITYKATASFDYVEAKDAPDITWSERLKAIFSNKPLIIMVVSIFILSLMQALGGVQTYFVVDVLGRGDLLLSFSLVMMPAMILSMALMPIAMKFEKSAVMAFGSALYVVISVIWYFVPNENVTLMLILSAVRYFGLGFGMILMWSMLTDCVDYATLKTGRHQGGIIFSTTTFMQKAASGVGAALMNALLAVVGFIPGLMTQSIQASQNVKMLMTIGTGVMPVIVVVLMFIYPLSKSKMKSIEMEIAARKSSEG